MTRALKGWVQADEVVDTKPLFEEISKLANENRTLKDMISELEKRPATQLSKQNETIAGLWDVLSAVEVDIPAILVGGKAVKCDLLSFFYNNRDALINGVTNQSGISDSESFMFFKVCPKLQVHGLVVNERVVGARYRRYAVTSLGNALLSEVEKRKVLIAKEKGESSTSATPSTQDTSASAPERMRAAKPSRKHSD